MDSNSNEIEAVDNAALSQRGDGCIGTPHLHNTDDPRPAENVDHLNNKTSKSVSAGIGRGDSPSVTNANHTDSPGATIKDDVRASFDPQKAKERDERLRQARERREEAERRRQIELYEAMARQQDARKRQEEERRRKIEEMKKREEEHRNIVEERKRRLLNEENERKQAILKRTAEREARLEQMKPVKKSPVSTAFGGCAMHVHVTGSSQNIVSPTVSLRRSAISVRDVFRSNDATSVATSGGTGNIATGGASGSPVALKRLSMSTGHLGARKPLRDKTPTSENIATEADDKDKEGEDVIQPLGAASGSNQSEAGTLSTSSPVGGGGSMPQQQRRRPRSLVSWRSPNYAADTVSSLQLKSAAVASRHDCSGAGLSAGPPVVCSRFRSVSPTVTKVRARSTGPPGVRKSRVDTHKPVDHTVSATRDTASASARKAAPASSSVTLEPSQKLARVKSMPSKLNVDHKKQQHHGAGTGADAATTATPPSSDFASSRARTASAKRMTHSAINSLATTPTAGHATPTSVKSMPNPPKSMAPRSVPKEPKAMKEVTSNKSATTSKGVVKVIHKVLMNQSATTTTTASGDKKTEEPATASDKLPTADADTKQTPESEVKVLPDDIAAAVIPAAPVAVTPAVEKTPSVAATPAASLPVAAPAAEKTDAAKKPTTEADDYKAKLAENRRLAREKAEREAAEEREREEQRRRAEEEQRRREEEEQQRREEEELRLAEEARRLEMERFQRAVEEEEKRRKEEEERLETERREREEQERLARDEAERKEKERLEKLKREDEERLERKKKLEMIMKRVKTDEGSLQKSDTLSSPASSMAEGINKDSSGDESTSVRPLAAQPLSSTDNSTSQFRSPLLRQMMGGKLGVPRVGSGSALAGGNNGNGSSADADLARCDASQSQVDSSSSECSVATNAATSSPDQSSQSQAASGNNNGAASQSLSACTIDSVESTSDRVDEAMVSLPPVSGATNGFAPWSSDIHDDTVATVDVATLEPSPRIVPDILSSSSFEALQPDVPPSLANFSNINGSEVSSECKSSNGFEAVDNLATINLTKPLNQSAIADDRFVSGDQPSYDETIDLSTTMPTPPSESDLTDSSRPPPSVPLIAFE